MTPTRNAARNGLRTAIVLTSLVLGLLVTAAVGQSAETLQILARDNVFDPSTLTLQAGDTVVWKNVGTVSHTVTAADGSFHQLVRAGQEFRRTFARPGSVRFYCSFHGTQSGAGMAGRLQINGVTVRSKDRIAGDDRIATAVAMSQYQFPNGADEVYLARSDVNPDALVGGALTQGPILLVPPCGTLPPQVKAEIDRLDPVKVVALGGENSVCEAMLDQALAP